MRGTGRVITSAAAEQPYGLSDLNKINADGPGSSFQRNVGRPRAALRYLIMGAANKRAGRY